jgi:hypothetical protein
MEIHDFLLEKISEPREIFSKENFENILKELMSGVPSSFASLFYYDPTSFLHVFNDVYKANIDLSDKDVIFLEVKF